MGKTCNRSLPKQQISHGFLCMDDARQKNAPLLSICIPSYNRPLLLGRAISSITQNNIQFSNSVEIIVSDDSKDRSCEDVVQETLALWEGHWFYRRNVPPLGMAKNWNNVANLASGDYILILHDDDFLTKDGLRAILNVLSNNIEKRLIFLFGVKVVDIYAKKYLYPPKAIENLLLNSSFVRFPGIVLHRKVFHEIGYFNEEIGEIADLDMWVRSFAKYGISCEPDVVSCYTIHQDALTTHMFHHKTIGSILSLFHTVEESNIVSSEIIERCKANFFHQFILAGAFRYIQQRKFKKAKRVLKLFGQIDLSRSQVMLRWKIIKLLLEIFFVFHCPTKPL
jgi:glycosyltransferase involved in cell wall biosynthesis